MKKAPFLSAKEHYDCLIYADNDAARDSAVLRAYMDGWDGEVFLTALALSGKERVLEIGVGTGRLASRTAPLCRAFTGIDFSSKTLARAKENLSAQGNVTLLCGDYLTTEIIGEFDVIYSSLTLMHFENKALFFEKTYALLAESGRFILSIDKDRRQELDMGEYRVRLFPDEPEATENRLKNAGFYIKKRLDMPFAHGFICEKAL